MEFEAMNNMPYIQPKEIKIGDQVFVISKMPATEAREVIYKYPKAVMGANLDYETSEEVMYKVLSYVQVKTKDGRLIPLTDKMLINQHISSGKDLMTLEKEMLTYNFDFFDGGKPLNS